MSLYDLIKSFSVLAYHIRNVVLFYVCTVHSWWKTEILFFSSSFKNHGPLSISSMPLTNCVMILRCSVVATSNVFLPRSLWSRHKTMPFPVSTWTYYRLQKAGREIMLLNVLPLATRQINNKWKHSSEDSICTDIKKHHRYCWKLYKNPVYFTDRCSSESTETFPKYSYTGFQLRQL